MPFLYNSGELTNTFMPAPAHLKDQFKIDFNETGFYEDTVSTMLVKSGVTDLGDHWFTAPHDDVRFYKEGQPRPFVKLYGACIPDPNSPTKTLTKGQSIYIRWNNNYIQSSSNSSFSSPTNEKQSFTGLMFVELQAGGGGGGGPDTDAGNEGGGGGGGGAYISMLINLSYFKYVLIELQNKTGVGGAKETNGAQGGYAVIYFCDQNDSITYYFCVGGVGGERGDSNGGGGAGGTTEPKAENIVDRAGIKILRVFYGKSGGKGEKLTSDRTDGGEFISTDNRYFGSIIDSINIEGGADNIGGIIFGNGTDGGGGGAAALHAKGYGTGGAGGSVGNSAYSGGNGKNNVAFLYY